jgi:hypothetical protein
MERKLWIELIALFAVFCMLVPASVEAVSLPVKKQDILRQGCENRGPWKRNETNTIFMKGNASLIFYYKAIGVPCHLANFWFYSDYSYCCFFMNENFTLRINGDEQKVDVPVVVIPWKFLGFGEFFWISNYLFPTRKDFTLIGVCEKVILEPWNSTGV